MKEGIQVRTIRYPRKVKVNIPLKCTLNKADTKGHNIHDETAS